ncbi:MAG: hypothetical protein EPN30_11505 [Actinomycetota bacterium]|nr:MAG: hypothetical protein EPN30_11505 [Actinomycetota bacterium]
MLRAATIAATPHSHGSHVERAHQALVRVQPALDPGVGDLDQLPPAIAGRPGMGAPGNLLVEVEVFGAERRNSCTAAVHALRSLYDRDLVPVGYSLRVELGIGGSAATQWALEADSTTGQPLML